MGDASEGDEDEERIKKDAGEGDENVDRDRKVGKVEVEAKVWNRKTLQ